MARALHEYVTFVQYKYLIDSIEKFYSQEEFLDKIKKQNFSNASYRNLSGGIVAIHSAWKI